MALHRRRTGPKRLIATSVLLLATTVIFTCGVLTHSSALARRQNSKSPDKLSKGSVQAKSRQLYVLDTKDWRSLSEVLLLDTVQNHVLKRFSTPNAGYAPDMVLSPDGSRLYVASMRLLPDSGGLIDTFDTYSGVHVAETENPDAIVKQQFVYRSRMAMSPTGKYIYMLKMKGESFAATLHEGISGQDADDLYVTAFDTGKNQFLPLHISLGSCHSPLLLSTNQDLMFDVVCSDSNSVLAITASESDAAPNTNRMLVNGYSARVNGVWAAAFELPDRGKIALFAQDGSLFALDRNSGTVQAADKNV